MRTAKMSARFPETPDIETSSADYAKRFAGKLGEWFLKVQEETTLRMLAEFPGASILDVGGGHAQTAYALVEAGYHVTVLGSAEICRNRLGVLTDGGRCVFQIGNILDLPFADRSFEVAISYRLVSHVNQWKTLLSEISRVARKAVIIDYPSICSANCLIPLLFHVKKLVEGNTRTYRSFRTSEILGVLEKAGFVPMDSYPQFFIPMAVHRAFRSMRFSHTIETLSRMCGLTALLGSPVILKAVRVDG